MVLSTIQSFILMIQQQCRRRKRKIHITYHSPTWNRYSTALFGLLKLALSARITWSRSNPMDMISITMFSYSWPVTSMLSADTWPEASEPELSVVAVEVLVVEAGGASVFVSLWMESQNICIHASTRIQDIYHRG